MGLFDKIKKAAANVANAAQGALTGVNVAKAEAGDAAEQFKYGAALRTGKLTIRKDEAKAVELFRKASDQGNTDAMNALGECLRDGVGTESDPTAAVAFFRKAADVGLAAAQTNLGDCLMSGTGCGKDEAGAVMWFGKASEGGNTRAMFLLADALWNGVGTVEDRDKANGWLAKAAEGGSDDARVLYAERLWAGDHAEKNRAKAEELWTAARRNEDAARYLAALAFVRSGAAGKTDADISDAVRTREAFILGFAADGDADAQYAAARLLASDASRAAESGDWMRKAADQGHVKAAWAVIGTMGDSEDVLPARLKLLAFAAEGGIGKAAWELSWRYANGTGVGQDDEKYWKYLPIAADGDVAEAQFLLAKAYDAGEGPFGQDSAKRNAYLRKARKLGHAEATEWINAIEREAAEQARASLAKAAKTAEWVLGGDGGGRKVKGGYVG